MNISLLVLSTLKEKVLLPTESLLTAVGDPHFSAKLLTLVTMSSSNSPSEIQGKETEVA
jgi:hypothetical protein